MAQRQQNYQKVESSTSTAKARHTELYYFPSFYTIHPLCPVVNVIPCALSVYCILTLTYTYTPQPQANEDHAHIYEDVRIRFQKDRH